MIHRFFCLLFVPLMLANQGLCFAHTHHGTDVLESEDHALRPHFHFGGRGHHDATHDSTHDDNHKSGADDVAGPSKIVPVDDHDADAIYCAEASAVAAARDEDSLIVLSAKCVAVAVAAILGVSHQNDDWLPCLSLLRGQPASVFDAACPLYLRTLSLRI